MAYWLLKSEPETYGWEDLLVEGRTEWTGVRNPAAALHLKAMQVGDQAFFYHSGKPREIVGMTEIIRAAQQDGDAARWVSVAIKPVAPLPRPVSLAAIKAAPALGGMEMVRQSRLSVSPVRETEWAAILAMAESRA